MMKLLKNQQYHLLSLILLLVGTYFYVLAHPSILQGEYYGIDTSTWFWIAILSPIIHQVYVVVCWRLELYKQSISRTFVVQGFKLYKIGFSILILSRIVTIYLLAKSSASTLTMNPTITYILAGIFLVLSLYTLYSVRRYFSMDRAFGIDHFNPEKYKNESFEKRGIFRYTSNAMYIYGFLILYVPGLLLFSKAALVIALFNHIYIWIHYYCTELPDIKVIYQN